MDTMDGKLKSNLTETNPLLTDRYDTESAQSAVNKLPKWRKYAKLAAKRSRYYIPITGWLPKYDKSLLVADLTAGLSTAAMIIPQSMAYATTLMKIEPVYGLYASIFPAIIYALFVGPSAVVTLLASTAISQVTEHDGIDKLAVMAVLSFLVGLVSLLLGIVRMGCIDSLMSRVLLAGLVNGIAIYIGIGQFPTLIGLIKPADASSHPSTIETLQIIFSRFATGNWATAATSIGSIVFLVLFKLLKKKYKNAFFKFFPTPFMLVLIFTYFSWQFNLEAQGVKILGPVSGGFQMPSAPKFQGIDYHSLGLGAIMVTIIGFVEAIAGSKKFATEHNYSISANRELVAFGLANCVSSFFHSFPVTCSLSRSVIHNSNGAKTQIAGLVTSIFVILTVLFALPLFQFLPIATMASIVAFAVLNLFELHEITYLIKLRAYGDLILLHSVFLVTIFVSLEFGTLFMIGCSLILVIKDSTKPRLSVLGQVDGSYKFRNVKDFPFAKSIDEVLILRIEEPLSFANAGQLKDKLKRIELHGDLAAHPSDDINQLHLKFVIFDVEAMTAIDASALALLTEVIQDFENRKVKVCFVKLKDTLKPWFLKAGIFDLVGSVHFFRKINDGLEFIKSKTGYEHNVTLSTYQDL